MIREFLEKYRPGGLWALTAIIPDGKTETHTYPQAEVDEAVTWAKAENKRKNIYFAVNPTTKPVEKKANKEDIARVEYLQVDIDPRAGEDLHEERERILKLLTDNLPKDIPAPTLIIDSGGGFQAFWRLSEPLELNGDPEKIAQAEAYNKELANRLGGDSCHNIDRIMRLPGTTNWPNAKKREKGRTESEAEVYCWNDVSYPITAFKPAPVTNGASNSQSYATGKARAAITLGDGMPMGTEELRQWAEANGKTINDHTLALIATGQDPLDPTKYPSRSEALFRVCCDLVRAEIPDEIVFAVITDQNNEISASVRDKPNWQGYAQKQVESAKDACADPILAEMNEKHAVLLQEGGKCRVLSWERNEIDESRLVPVLQSFDDFRNRYMNRRVTVGFSENGHPIEKPLGKWWLEHTKRRQYLGLRFLPGKPEEVNDYLNMWRGYAVMPKKGDWSLMRNHITQVLGSGNPEYGDYILRWAAWAVQNPDVPAEVALVFRGGRGTGKGMFARALKKLFGQHGLQVSSPAHLTGRFNSHLRDTVLLFADEAIAPSDLSAVGVLKTLVTEPELVIEGKGVNIVQARNLLHIVMASNEQWVVPAGIDERRFAVFDVSGEFAQQGKYFGPLAEQLNKGGYEAMLYDLLNMDLGDWHPRQNVPKTEALNVQKAEGLKGFEAYLFDLLQSGEAPPGAEHLRGGSLFVRSQDLLDGVEKKWKPGDSSLTHRRIQMLLVDKLGAKKHRKPGSSNGYIWNLAGLRSAWDRGMFKWPWEPMPADYYDPPIEDNPF